MNLPTILRETAALAALMAAGWLLLVLASLSNGAA